MKPEIIEELTRSQAYLLSFVGLIVVLLGWGALRLAKYFIDKKMWFELGVYLVISIFIIFPLITLSPLNIPDHVNFDKRIYIGLVLSSISYVLFNTLVYSFKLETPYLSILFIMLVWTYSFMLGMAYYTFTPNPIIF